MPDGSHPLPHPVAAEAIAQCRALLAARPMTKQQRQLSAEAARDLRAILAHLDAYNDRARSLGRPRLSAVGVRRELDAIERDLASRVPA